MYCKLSPHINVSISPTAVKFLSTVNFLSIHLKANKIDLPPSVQFRGINDIALETPYTILWNPDNDLRILFNSQAVSETV